MTDPTLQVILDHVIEMKADIGAIKTQVTTTNGRVTTLEGQVDVLDDQQKKVKYTVMGATAVISTVVAAAWQWITK